MVNTVTTLYVSRLILYSQSLCSTEEERFLFSLRKPHLSKNVPPEYGHIIRKSVSDVSSGEGENS